MPIKNSSSKKDNREASHILKEFEKPFETALYFGFTPIKTPEVSREDNQKLKSLKDPHYDSKLIQEEFPFVFNALEKISILRTFEDWGFSKGPQPTLLAYKKPIIGTHKKKPANLVLGLEVIDLHGSCAEAILLRTTLSILRDEGFNDVTVHINSIGDKDSVSEFEKTVSGFVRKHMNGFPADIRKMAKKDIFDILRSSDEKHLSIQEQAPKSLSFLSEPSRNQCQEVLEYLEAFDVPYQISPRLIGAPTFCSHTVFEIRNNDGTNKNILAQGYGYSRLAKKIGFKKDLSACGATIVCKKKGGKSRAKTVALKPKIYLIQLGFGAKLFSLPLLENLRKARIHVAHSLSKDKLGSQLASAENMKVSSVLIVGQKEALDKTVTVRDMNTRAQETVPADELVEYLRKLK